MNLLTRLKLFFLLTFTTLIFSCTNQEPKNKDTVIDGNVSTTISTDVKKLEKLIDLSKYKPTQVKFKYVFIDNSGQSQRLSVPGPSDSYLEAVLYYDEDTFNRLSADNALLSTISTGRKEAYQFDWLENDIKSELNSWDNLDHPPTFFIKSGLRNGGYFMLHNKILLKLHSN